MREVTSSVQLQIQKIPVSFKNQEAKSFQGLPMSCKSKCSEAHSSKFFRSCRFSGGIKGTFHRSIVIFQKQHFDHEMYYDFPAHGKS